MVSCKENYLSGKQHHRCGIMVERIKQYNKSFVEATLFATNNYFNSYQFVGVYNVVPTALNALFYYFSTIMSPLRGYKKHHRCGIMVENSKAT